MLVKIKRFDWLTVFILLGFMTLSYLLIHSAIFDNPTYKNSNMDKKTLFFFGLGFLVLFGSSFFNYRLLVKFWWVLYAIGIMLLLGLYKFGVVKNSALSWYELPGGLNFQPVELVKLILIISIAGVIARRNGEHIQLLRDVLPIGVLVFIPFALVLDQPDLGNALIFLVVVVGMLWIGNLKYSYVLVCLAILIGFMSLFFYFYNKHHDEWYSYLEASKNQHWMDRIDTFIDPDSVDDDKSYQVDKSMTAIGSGGLNGDGYKQGNSVRNRFIPLPFSDSIFVVLGEEFGFVGAAILLLLYFMMLYRMILIAIQCDQLSGALIITGIVSMFVFQIFENVGMLIGIMPLTGITLPFISYGGSSVLINMLCLGIVNSIRIHREEPSPY